MAIVSPETIFSVQTVFLALVFISMGFRMKGKFCIHVAILAVSAVVVLIGFVAVLLLAFMNGVAINALSSPVLFAAHGFFGALAITCGIIMTALWHPKSTEFAAKSRRIWQVTMASWIGAFLIGVLLYTVLYTTLLR